LAPISARAPALRRVGGVLGSAPAEPLADLHAERGRLLPARRRADVLLGRLRVVPRSRAGGPALAPSPRVVGSRRRHARPRPAQQVRGGALDRGGGPLRADTARAAPLAGTPRTVPRAGHRPTDTRARRPCHHRGEGAP